MTTVQELNVLHRRYADISHRFRAAWTFHQFLQSLEKAVLERSSSDYSADFQGLYSELKEISQNLNASETDRIRGRLDGIDRRLSELIGTLEEEDSRVAPNTLRQFFRRVKSYDEKILLQLVKFYLYSHHGGGWEPMRLDKIDFLLARLSEEERDPAGPAALRDYTRLTEVFEGLWALLGAAPPAPEVVQGRRRAIEAMRAEIGGMESLDELNEHGLVRRYRELKHGLGDLFFEPQVQLAVQSTNLALRARIQQLYRREERRIAAEYQRVFELEREVPGDHELDRDLSLFREEIERFEKRLESDDFKLEDLAQIRLRVRSLLPRLTEAGGRPAGRDSAARLFEDTGELRRAAAPPDPSRHVDLIGEPYRRMVGALQELPPGLAPEQAVLKPEIFPLRIEAREVAAWRRLSGGEPCDRELEQFVLEAAAVRVQLNEEAQEIASILDETSHTGEAPIYDRARQTTRIADTYVWGFNHHINQTLLDGDVEEARRLQVLRMRLMRDYSGLWLLAYKPFYSGRAPRPSGES